jgi:hypothetical protein
LQFTVERISVLAPREVLRRFRADLWNQGLTFQEEILLPGVLSACRLFTGPKHRGGSKVGPVVVLEGLSAVLLKVDLRA